MSNINAIKLVKIFSFPIILYAIMIGFRVFDLQPEVEEGHLGDFITALNFLFGAFVAYFVFIYFIVSKESISRFRSVWWWSVTILFAFLAFDELFRIHENLGMLLGIEDTFILLSYGAALGVLLLFNLDEIKYRNTFIALAIFAAFGILAQVTDYLFFEGTVSLAGKEISYEQFAESFGALSLTSAIVTIAFRRFIEPEPQDGTVEEPILAVPVGETAVAPVSRAL